MKTNQELFDQSVSGLLRQGKPAIDAEGGCKYLAKDGCKCAVGQLIPPECYTSKAEGVAVRTAETTRPVLKTMLACSRIGEDSYELLRSLQTIHDSVKPIFWKGRFKQIAENFNLSWKFEDWELGEKRELV